MCGILGVFSKNGPLEGQLFKSGLKFLKRRGPDASEIKILKQSRVILGHTRLSIIDVSANGNQPLSNEQGDLWIIYNGEIYNYLELREELILRGRNFKSDTDTEVLIQAYEEWGPEFVSRLRGIYAFLIYYDTTDTLSCRFRHYSEISLNKTLCAKSRTIHSVSPPLKVYAHCPWIKILDHSPIF